MIIGDLLYSSDDIESFFYDIFSHGCSVTNINHTLIKPYFSFFVKKITFS